MTGPKPTHDPAVPPGAQTGKRDAEERNDPETQPGARRGKPEPDTTPAPPGERESLDP